ncbi:unnamed protein product, partial [Vitis vinifera]
MVHHQRYHQLRKGEDDEEAQSLVDECGSAGYYKRTRPKLLALLFLSLLSCCFVLAPCLFSFPIYSFGEYDGPVAEMDAKTLCSSIANGTICCDRSAFRTDTCFMKGDVRTHSSSSSIFLYGKEFEEEQLQHEKIKPYTRKWEASVMDTIDELHLISKKEGYGTHHHCDVHHDVPAVFFSTGGYTGNIYHEFNDGILPLYITSQHLNKRVVFVILEYHDWWITKYGDVISQLSDYPPIDFSGDNRTHCFPEAIVGLRIHDELTVDSSLVEGNESIRDFRNLLDQAYLPRIRSLIQAKEQKQVHQLKKPKLVVLSRTGARAITNEDLMVQMAKEIGFQVKVLRPNRATELAKIYRVLNSSDAMVGVHGAAMTHILFLQPGSVFIQVIPLGTEWPAETYYGEPAEKLGLKYMGYKILPRESSLYNEYAKDDPVLRDPDSLAKKGWEFTKRVYLDHQTVTLDLRRFRKQLVCAYDYYILKASRHSHFLSY